MRLTIKPTIDNAAFEEGGTEEVRRILDDLCDRLPEPLGDTNGDLNLHDSNGNHCGTARIS